MTRELICHPNDIPIGSLLNEDLFNEKGVLICSKMTLIDEKLHKKLLHHNCRVRVIVNSTRTTLNELSETIASKEDKSFDFTDEIKNQAKESIETIFDNLDDPEHVVDTARHLSSKLCEHIKSSKDIGINLEKLKVSDDYTFKHSVDVGTMASLLATHMKKSDKFIQEVMIAGILHDIGKSKIPNAILNKPGKLTDEEFEIMKKHPIYSYYLLKDCTDIPESVRQAVINHHENVDGSGYPRGLTDDKIGEMAKILAISDVFDALVTKRVYKPAKTPAQAIEMMFSMGNKFDLTVFKAFLAQINAYPNGSIVTLSNGMICKVIEQNAAYPLRPIVEEITTRDRIDLSTNMKFLSVTIST
jgi:HD-GYP domain-containing protein (c-di-GMP phosphodiesterase class II)